MQVLCLPGKRKACATGSRELAFQGLAPERQRAPAGRPASQTPGRCGPLLTWPTANTAPLPLLELKSLQTLAGRSPPRGHRPSGDTDAAQRTSASRPAVLLQIQSSPCPATTPLRAVCCSPPRARGRHRENPNLLPQGSWGALPAPTRQQVAAKELLCRAAGSRWKKQDLPGALSARSKASPEAGKPPGSSDRSSREGLGRHLDLEKGKARLLVSSCTRGGELGLRF